jgi:signal peptidase I
MITWDLPTILVVILLITALIWLYDVLYAAPKRRVAIANLPDSATAEMRYAVEKLPVLVDTARSLFPVIFIVFMLRSFLAEPFRIPSNSMMPTLLTGDFILVNKYDYGIRLPIFNKKIFEVGQPKHGDIVVFRYPGDPTIPYIKRIVGVGGDKISYNHETKILSVNGKSIEQTPTGVYQGVGAGSNMTGAEEKREQLMDVSHAILIRPDLLYSKPPFTEFTVPMGHYFVLGDNRDNSKDSRYWGTVPDENIMGRAFLIWMNFDFSNKNGIINWQRVGTHLQ